MFCILKIESCGAGFSACGGSRSDKFCSAAVRSSRSDKYCSAAVRSMRSAFLPDRKCDAISYQAKKRSHCISSGSAYHFISLCIFFVLSFLPISCSRHRAFVLASSIPQPCLYRQPWHVCRLRAHRRQPKIHL